MANASEHQAEGCPTHRDTRVISPAATLPAKLSKGAALALLAFTWASCSDSDSPTDGGDGSGAEIVVTGASVATSEVLVDEPVEVTATLQNLGDEAGTETVELEVDGDVEATESVTVEAEAEAEVGFSWSTEEPGAYSVGVNGTHAGTVTVEAEPAPTADLQIEDTWAEPETVQVGEAVTVTATVRNHGDAEGEKTLELQVDGDGVESQTVSVDAPGEGEDPADTEEEVTFSWSTDEPAAYALSVNGNHAGTVTVEPEPEADIQVEDADASPTTVQAGEDVTVTATVENHGDADGQKTLELEVDGQEVESQTVSVDAGDQETVTFSWSTNDPGDYDLAVNGHHAGTVTVEPEPEADIQVEDADASPTTVQTGEDVTVTATVENHGDADGQKTLELEVDGQGVETQTVSVDAGDQEAATFSWSTDDPGDYELSVNGHHAGTVTVEPEPAELSITSTYTDPSDPVETMTAVAVAEVSNTGGAAGALTVDFAVNGSQEGSETVQVGPGDTETVGFDWTPSEDGEHELTFNQHSIDVDVLSATELTDTWLPNEQVYIYQTAIVAVELLNRTNTDQPVELILQVFTWFSGQPMWVTVDDASGTIDPGTTTAPGFGYDAPEVGEWPLRVNGQEAGILEAYGIEVTDAYLGQSTVQEGQELDVGVDAHNHADDTVQEDLTLQVYAPPTPNRPPRWLNVETEEWTMTSGQTIEWGAAFSLSLSEPGEYPVRVCDEVSCEDAGTVTVVDSD